MSEFASSYTILKDEFAFGKPIKFVNLTIDADPELFD